ncbi:unnamed protein product [Coregonus sp. 'balchen']|nr:unnamed protein product [Coregonus sp. 'balchen']
MLCWPESHQVAVVSVLLCWLTLCWCSPDPRLRVSDAAGGLPADRGQTAADMGTTTYEPDGGTHDSAWGLKTYQDETRQFVSEHPDFLGDQAVCVRTPRLPGRPGSLCQNTQTSWETRQFVSEHPDFLGARVIFTVHRWKTLWYFKEALSLPGERRVNLPFFFHSGDTDEDRTDMDGNLLDALLFNTSCLGQGFALLRHPVA